MRNRTFAAPNHFRRLPIRARVWARLFIAVPLIAFIAFAVIRTIKLSQVVNRDMGPIVASALNQAISHEFRIGAIHARIGSIEIDNVGVSTRSTFAASHGQAALTAPKVVVNYNVDALLSDPNDIGRAITTITLYRATGFAERYTGKSFNFSDLIKHRNGKPFTANIVVVDSNLTFRDDTEPKDPDGNPATNSFEHVNGTIDCASVRVVRFTAAGVNQGGRIATAKADGVILRTGKGYRVDADVTGGDVVYFARYLHLSPLVRVSAGRADAEFTILAPGAPIAPIPPRSAAGSTTVDIFGTATVRRGRVAWRDTGVLRAPLNAVQGNFTYASRLTPIGVRAQIGGDADFLLDGQSVEARGIVFGLGTPHPSVNVALASSSFDPRLLSHAFTHMALPLGWTAGPSAADLIMSGLAQNPTLAGTVHSNWIRYAGNRITQVDARVVFAHKLLGIDDATGIVDGSGRATLTAGADLSGPKPVYTASGAVSGLSISSVSFASASQPGNQPTEPSHPRSGAGASALSGPLNAVFVAHDAGDGLIVESNVSVAGARLEKTPMRLVQGRVLWNQDGKLTLDRLAIDDPIGRALVSGSIDMNAASPQLALTVNADGVILNRLIAPYGPRNLGGIGYFVGNVNGTEAKPKMAGTINVFRAYYGRFGADVVDGKLTASADAITCSGLQIHRYPADVTLTGSIRDLSNSDPLVALHASVQGAQLADISALLGAGGRRKAALLLPHGRTMHLPAPTPVNPIIEGSLDGSVSVAGRLMNPEVTGSVNIEDLTVGGSHIDSASAGIHVADRKVAITHIVVSAADASVSGDLSWSMQTGSIQGMFSGTNVEMYRFQAFTRPYADVQGNIDFSGQVSGTAASPMVSFGVTSDNLAIDGQSLQGFSGFGSYSNGEIMSSAPWVLTFPVVPAISGLSGGATHEVQYWIDSFTVETPTPVNHLTGPRISLDAHIPADTPETLSHILTIVRSSRLATTSAGRSLIAGIDRLPQPVDATIAAPRTSPADAIEISGPLSSPVVSGEVDFSQLASGENTARTATVDFEYAGGASATASASLSAQDVQLFGAPIASLTAAGALEHGVINLSKLEAIDGAASITASGTVDLNGAIQGSVTALQVPLANFDRLVPPERELGGTISNLKLTASGQTASPDLSATVDILNPSLQAGKAGSAAPFALNEITSGPITLESQRPGGPKVLSVTNLTAMKDDKPVAVLSGSIPINLENLHLSVPRGQPLYAQLHIADIGVLQLAVPLLDASRTHGTLDVNVQSGQESQSGAITGTLEIGNAAIGLTGVDTSLQQVNGQVSFDQDHAVVDWLGGASSAGGTFAIDGSVNFRRRYYVELATSLKGFYVDERSSSSSLRQLYGSVGRGRIDGKVLAQGPFDSLTIATPKTPRALVVSDASIELPSTQPPPEPKQAPLPLDPEFNVTVTLGSSAKPITVYYSVLRDAEVDGEVRITQRLSAPIHIDTVEGQFPGLSIEGGTLVLPAVLRIDKGGWIALHYPVATGINEPPTMSENVNLTAETTINASPASLLQTASAPDTELVGPTTTTAAAEKMQPYHVTVTASGELNTPNFHFEATAPGLSNEEATSIFVNQNPAISLLRNPGASSQALVGFLPYFTEPIDTQLEKDLGLSDFAVDYTTGSTSVTATVPVGPRSELTLFRSFGPRSPNADVDSAIYTPQYQLKLSYDLTKRLRISMSTDDQQNNTVTLDGVMAF